jgi:hypothetical protein
VVLGVAIYIVLTNWRGLRAVTFEMGAPTIAASGLLGVVGTSLICQVWRAFLVGVGVKAPRADVNQVFFVTQLGKYLPGSVWPVIAQMEAGRRWATGRSAMLVTSALMLVVLTATGLGLGIALLPWSSSAGLREYWWTLLFLLPLGALLHPKVLPWVLDQALRLVGREPARVRLAGRAMLQGGLWSLAVWFTLGLHIYVLIASLGAEGWKAVGAAVGGMALAWAIGLIVIPAPAGAGVRDTVLVLTLSPLVGPTAALTVALASRMLLLCADLLLAGSSLLFARLLGRAGRVRRRTINDDGAATSDPDTAASG